MLWAEPVARYWAPSDDVFVVRLVRLRENLDELGPDAPLGMYAAVLALSGRSTSRRGSAASGSS